MGPPTPPFSSHATRRPARRECVVDGQNQPSPSLLVLQREGVPAYEGVARRPWMAGGMGTDGGGPAKAIKSNEPPQRPGRARPAPRTPRAARPLLIGAAVRRALVVRRRARADRQREVLGPGRRAAGPGADRVVADAGPHVHVHRIEDVLAVVRARHPGADDVAWGGVAGRGVLAGCRPDEADRREVDAMREDPVRTIVLVRACAERSSRWLWCSIGRPRETRCLLIRQSTEVRMASVEALTAGVVALGQLRGSCAAPAPAGTIAAASAAATSRIGRHLATTARPSTDAPKT